MAQGVDLSKLSPAERAVAASGAILFLDGFAPWWYRIRTPEKTYLHNAGLTGWGLLAVMAGFLVTVIVIATTVRKHRMKNDFVLYFALGTGAVAALAMQGRSPAGEWIGYWVAVAAGLAMLVSSLRRMAERRGGWV